MSPLERPNPNQPLGGDAMPKQETPSWTAQDIRLAEQIAERAKSFDKKRGNPLTMAAHQLGYHQSFSTDPALAGVRAYLNSLKGNTQGKSHTGQEVVAPATEEQQVKTLDVAWVRAAWTKDFYADPEGILRNNPEQEPPGGFGAPFDPNQYREGFTPLPPKKSSPEKKD